MATIYGILIIGSPTFDAGVSMAKIVFKKK
jgi:hypothetical protein